jgi:hypothetical protein
LNKSSVDPNITGNLLLLLGADWAAHQSHGVLGRLIATTGFWAG